MNDDLVTQIAKEHAEKVDKMTEQFLVNNGLLTNADPKPVQIDELRKSLEERGYKLLETRVVVGGITTYKLELVKIIDVMKYSIEFRLEGANIK